MIENHKNDCLGLNCSFFAITPRVDASEDQFADHGNLRPVSRSRKGAAQDVICTDP